MTSAISSPTPTTGYISPPEREWLISPVYTQDPIATKVLQSIAAREEAPGHLDIGTLNTLYTFIVNLRPRRVLEVGTHNGFALRLNGHGKLQTLEPQIHYQVFAAENINAADLTSYVEIVPHFSYDLECQAPLRKEARSLPLH